MKSNHAGEIRRLISNGKIKSAVNRAKQLHRGLGTAESEAILVEAYIARILEMNEKGLTVETDTLLDMVRRRYHLPVARLAEIEAAAAVRDGINEAFLAPLNDPTTPTEYQSAILNIIKEKVVDLNILADCKTLSPQHPLKVQVAAIQKAFEAVTSGPVHEKEIVLPGIPRRSPLAPWKMLIRALFFFYRHEDAYCKRSLKAVEIGSAPGRLVPVIRAMLRTETFGIPGENAYALTEYVTGNKKALERALQTLESKLTSGELRGLSPTIRDVVALCERFQPERLERLKQHISIRCWIMDADEKKVKKSMGGPSLKNAHFWKLLARAAEMKGEHFWACAMWNEFLKHAVNEGMFSANGLESSVVHFHVANLLLDGADSDFEWKRGQFEAEFHHSKGFAAFYKGQPGFITEAIGERGKPERHPDFLYPERLYKRVCEIDPSSEAFSNWLEWMEIGNFKKKNADQVAVSWHQAIPHDITPVLYLAKSAEKRNAFKKCLTFLDEAEQIDALHTAIRKIRLRVLVATAIRHLKRKKTHLAQKDFKEMEALPLFQVGDRPALLTALRWVCALIEGVDSKLKGFFDELARRLGSHLSATMILLELMKECGVPRDVSGVSYKSLEGLDIDDLPSSVGMACLLGIDVGIPIGIPPLYREELEDAFSMGTPALDAPVITAIGEAALMDDCMALAYAVSGVGLLKGGDTVAGFLLLRARSLPFRERKRKNDCIDAAIALARKERDMDLIDAAIELRRNGGGYVSPFPGRGMDMARNDFSTDPKALEALLKREKADREYPDNAFEPDVGDDWDDDDFEVHECRRCDAKNCRERKAEYDPDFDAEGWEDDAPWDENDAGFMEALLDAGLIDLPDDIPPVAVPLLLKIMSKYGDKNGELPELDEVFGKDPELLEALFETLPEFPFFAGPGKKKKRKGRR